MRDGQAIEWADVTWNPVRGCKKVGPGCEHCYAETFAERWRGLTNHPYEQGFDLRLVPEKLGEPLGWKKPRRIAVGSMSDLFQEDVPEAFIEAVFRTMSQTPRHTYQVLTKRPERMRTVLAAMPSELREMPHVWLGVSVEDRAHGLPRIEVLRDVPAALRFVCFEPLLEDLGPIDLSGISWVITAGETGPSARRMEEAWVLAIRDRCREAGVPFFFKQWGGVLKRQGGRVLAGETHDAVPLCPSMGQAMASGQLIASAMAEAS